MKNSGRKPMEKMKAKSTPKSVGSKSYSSIAKRKTPTMTLKRTVTKKSYKK
jgi:hypothetical protein